MLTSPLVRAHQTAEILAAELDSTPDIAVLDALAPDHRPIDVATALATQPRRASIALVGHEPDLGELAAWLIGTHEPLPFSKGGVCLHRGAECCRRAATAQLIWFATPKMLRTMTNR